LYGTAVNFDFSSSLAYINTPFSGAPSQNSALTYAAWIKPDALQMGIPNIIASSSGSRGYDFRLSLPTGGDGSVWNLSLNTGGFTVPAAANYITTATIPAGAWTHVAFTKDVNETGSAGAGTNTSALKFYMNGSLVESGDISQPGATTPSRYLFAAGRSGTSYYSGGIDEVRIYDEVLDATAIAALAAGLPAAPGDFNNDHKVNAADYVLWRKNPASFLPSTYDTWRSNFGNPPGSGSGLGDAGSVPEPGCGLLLSLVVCAWSVRRRRSF
jgi:hypothetical protein